jgi:hypothetical protein
VESITASRADYNLKPFFYTPLRDVDAVRYRHTVLRDLEKDAVFESVRAFAQQMRSMREHLAQADKLHYKFQKERWFLDAVGIYCQAVSALADELAVLDVESSGLLAFRDYLTGYTRSERSRPTTSPWPTSSPARPDRWCATTSLCRARSASSS